MARRWVGRAVEAVASTLEAYLPAQLRIVEAAEELEEGALVDPVEYVRAPIPYESRAPIVEVYADGWEWIDQRNRIMKVVVVVCLHHLGDSDVVAGKATLERYITALVDTLLKHEDADGQVIGFVLDAGQPEFTRGEDNRTRHIAAQRLDVHLQETELT